MNAYLTQQITAWSRENYPLEDYDIKQLTALELEQAISASETSTPSSFYSLGRQIEYLNEQLFSQYIVTNTPAYSDFYTRMEHWLKSCRTDHQRRILFSLVPKLFFLGKREYESMCMSLFQGPITRWIIDECHISLLDPDCNRLIHQGISETLFCPITDSFDISAFCHLNGITHLDHRPHMRDAAKFNTKDALIEYMSKRKLCRIVLLEDFIGTGQQSMKAITFACEMNIGPVLLCPLVIAPSGHRKVQELQSRYVTLQCAPGLVLDSSAIIRITPSVEEDPIFRELRPILRDLHSLILNNQKSDVNPYGFGHAEEGGGLLFVMYSNTPNNTLPIIHYDEHGWPALFPRSKRV